MSPNSWFSQPVYIPGGNPETMNEPNLLYPGQLGIRFSYINPPRTVPSTEVSEDGKPKTFKLVRSDSTMSVSPYDGAVAWFSSQYQHLVTTSPTALGRGRIAGVFKTPVTPGNYCCVQVKGLSRVKLTDASAAATAAGEFVVPSATAAKAEVVAAGTAATYPALGRGAGMLDLAARDALVDLDVPEVL